MPDDHEPEQQSEDPTAEDATAQDPTAEVWPWGPGDQPVRPSPKPGWTRTRKAGLGVAAVVLAGGTFGIVWAVTSGSNGSDSTTAAASQPVASSGPDSGQAAAGPDQGGPGGFGFDVRGPGGAGGMYGPGMGHKPTPAMAGTVTGVKGSTITIKDLMGFTRTIHTSSSTTYTRGGQPANSSAVTNGANIAAKGTVDKNGTDLDANKVAVRLPTVAGTVQSVTGSSFVVQGPDGATHTVTTTGSTTFHQGRNQASLSDVKQGVRVIAMGDRQSNGDLTASSVQVLPVRMQHPPNGATPGGVGESGQPGQPGEPGEPGQPGSTT